MLVRPLIAPDELTVHVMERAYGEDGVINSYETGEFKVKGQLQPLTSTEAEFYGGVANRAYYMWFGGEWYRSVNQFWCECNGSVYDLLGPPKYWNISVRTRHVEIPLALRGDFFGFSS